MWKRSDYPIPKGVPTPEITEHSMSPEVCHAIVDLMKEMGSCRVLELGGGISTVCFDIALRAINGREWWSLVSIDESLEWEYKTVNCGYDWHKNTTFKCLPLQREKYGLWYHIDPILFSGLPWDCIIVDGPSTHQEAQMRYPAVPILLNHTCIETPFVLDDFNREDERITGAKWITIFGMDFERIAVGSKELGVFTRATSTKD